MIPVLDILTLPAETKLAPVIVDQYAIIALAMANGYYFIDFEKIEIKANTWIFLTPGQIYAQDSTRTQGVMISFNESFLMRTPLDKGYLQSHAFFHETFHPTYFELEGFDQTNLDIILKLLIQEWSKPEKSEIILKSYLCILMELCERFGLKNRMNGFGMTDSDPRVKPLLNSIEEHYSSHHDATFYASILELTTKRANQISKEMTGFTITELLHKRLNLEMKRRIGFSTQPINIIAMELSFKDPAYFSTFFKKRNYCSPIDFRLKCQNNEIV